MRSTPSRAVAMVSGLPKSKGVLDSIHFPICAGSGLDGLSLGQQAFD